MTVPLRIGVLGGMGPEATVALMARLITATPASDDAGHVPLMVDMNPQVPSRIARLIEGCGPDPAPVLAAMASGLEAAGARALAMPCNTAHHYAQAICDAVSIPLLDMVDLSAAQAASRAGPGGIVGILASPAVRQIGIFDAALRRHGATAVYPADQHALLGAIRDIKRSGPSDASVATLAAAAADAAAQGAGVQLVACTEFSLIAGSVATRAEIIDTLDVLVAAMIDFSFGAQPVPTRKETPAAQLD